MNTFLKKCYSVQSDAAYLSQTCHEHSIIGVIDHVIKRKIYFRLRFWRSDVKIEKEVRIANFAAVMDQVARGLRIGCIGLNRNSGRLVFERRE